MVTVIGGSGTNALNKVNSVEEAPKPCWFFVSTMKLYVVPAVRPEAVYCVVTTESLSSM